MRYISQGFNFYSLRIYRFTEASKLGWYDNLNEIEKCDLLQTHWLACYLFIKMLSQLKNLSSIVYCAVMLSVSRWEGKNFSHTAQGTGSHHQSVERVAPPTSTHLIENTITTAWVSAITWQGADIALWLSPVLPGHQWAATCDRSLLRHFSPISVTNRSGDVLWQQWQISHVSQLADRLEQSEPQLGALRGNIKSVLSFYGGHIGCEWDPLMAITGDQYIWTEGKPTSLSGFYWVICSHN